MARLIDGIAGHGPTWNRLRDLVKRGRLPHALALTGPPGIGKQMLAWALAQLLLCEETETEKPCGRCPPCQRVANRQSEGVLLVEPTGTQIKLEGATSILTFLSLARLTPARIIIVDGAQALNPQAANSLLKIVEEPPDHTYFLFIVPEISRWLPTLRSRTQVVRLTPLSDEILAERSRAPEWMRRAARGSLGRLLELENSEDGEDLRRISLGFVTHSVRGERAGLDQILAATKERPVALRAVQFLQRTLRDWCVGDHAEALNVDQTADLAAVGEVSIGHRLDLWRQSFRMETDLLGFVDRNLVFENFYQRGGDGLD